MKQELWQRIEKIYQAALELPEADRSSFIKSSCHGDEDLSNEVQSLLSQEKHVGSFLEQPAHDPKIDAKAMAQGSPMDPKHVCPRCGEEIPADSRQKQCPKCLMELALEEASADSSASPTETAESPDAKHQTIGDYRIARLLGEGGMGVVYEAQQQHPRRAVALKVIRGGAYVSKDQVKRFQREAQALARLKHPGIAAIYESGRTKDGQHFFAMELVRGETLAEYARKLKDPATTKAGLRVRLSVFLQILEAVNYAHQRGVIHRDLKPSNILVQRAGMPSGTDSFQGVPIKILDFGLARITDTDLAVTTVVTDLGRVQGTLPYMSPEQLRGNPDEIDIRTDVYSLGVMLYELLSGRLPHDLKGARIHEAARAIIEEKPASLGKTVSSGRLDTDLETIVFKALEKEPARRYQSVSALAEDVRRNLADQPILARPPSTTYQLKKLIARHRTGFAFAAGVFLLLAAFSVFMTFQANRIAQQRDRANREAETAKRVSELMADLFEVADPSEARGNSITAREVLDRGAQRIERQLQDQPAVQAALQHTLGRVYANLGLFDQAERLVEAALATRRRVFGEESLEMAESWYDVAFLSLGQYRDFGEALEAANRSLAIRRRLLGDDHLDVAEALYGVGGAHMFLGHYESALDAYSEVLAIRKRHLGERHELVAVAMGEIGHTQSIFLNRFGEGEPLLLRSLEMKRELLGNSHPSTLETLTNVANHFLQTGKYEESSNLHREAVSLSKSVLGKTHLQTIARSWMASWAIRHEEGFEQAAQILEDILTQNRVETHPARPYFLLDLATYQAGLGRRGQAEQRFRQALQNASTVNLRAIVSSELAALLILQGRYPEAETLLEEGIGLLAEPFREKISFMDSESSILDFVVGLGTYKLPLLLFRRGEIHRLQRDPNRAKASYQEALQLQESVLSKWENDYPEAWYLRAEAEALLGACLKALGRVGEAEPLLVRSYGDVLKWWGPEDYRTREAHARIVELYREWGKPEKAVEWRAQTPPRQFQ